MKRHISHDVEVMQEVKKRCNAKFPAGYTSLEWNLMYDAVLCDQILDTLDWKLKNITIQVIQ